MVNELDLLIDKKESIKVNGQEFKLGTLSLGQTLKFSNLIVRFCISSADQLKNIGAAINGDSNFADALAILNLLPEKQVAELIAISLNTDDIEFCASISVEDLSEIVLTVCENNNIGKIVKNCSRAYKLIQTQIENASYPFP